MMIAISLHSDMNNTKMSISVERLIINSISVAIQLHCDYIVAYTFYDVIHESCGHVSREKIRETRLMSDEQLLLFV